MNVVLASSEVVPFAKTGGLADVCGALPGHLAELEMSPHVFMPAYRSALQSPASWKPLDIEFEIPIGSKRVRGSLMQGELSGGVPIYLVRQDEYFDRPGLYNQDGQDYADNCERFVFFCRGVMESIRRLGIRTDVLHANDWQTGLLPAYARTLYADEPMVHDCVTIMTIHNMAYQGQFWHWDMLLTGLDWKYFNWHQMEFHGHLNLLKTGIVFADAITTVSQQYAYEIQHPPHGCGLEDVLRNRRDALSGILNGVSYREWDPEHDPLIAQNFNASNWRDGKMRCKAALQQRMGLPVEANTPLLGLVGRLADQKGWDLVTDVMQRWLESRPVQWVILGTGDPFYHDRLQEFCRRAPQRVAAKLEFSNELAHQIEAGADLFVMPSRYEPCGLNQLYSLRYGTVPVVRETGGLADTITRYDEQSFAAGLANGFSFPDYDADQLAAELDRACQIWRDAPEIWQQLVETGMRQDWSWNRSAQRYVELYRRLRDDRQRLEETQLR